MPAGVSWPQYLRFSAAAFLSMMAGSQTVHHYYNPLKDIDAYIEREKAAATAAYANSETNR